MFLTYSIVKEKIFFTTMNILVLIEKMLKVKSYKNFGNNEKSRLKSVSKFLLSRDYARKNCLNKFSFKSLYTY